MPYKTSDHIYYTKRAHAKTLLKRIKTPVPTLTLIHQGEGFAEIRLERHV
jgi:hypothetical protein